MSDWRFLAVHSIHWIWPVLGLLIWVVLRGRTLQQVMVQHPHGTPFAEIAERQQKGQRIRMLLLGLSLISIVIALMQPVTFGQETVQESSIEADVVVALDLSKSMLAEDAPPNRLERAKYEVMEMVDAMPGYRFGLVGFAGSATVLCPLTKDVGFFQMTLNNASPKSISRGGTSIGLALRKGLDAFAGGTAPKLLILITDGEDHDSDPLGATEAVVELGIPVVTIGFGSEDGSSITMTDPQTGARTDLVDRDGNTVISRLDGDLLREIALKTEGAFIPAGVSSLDLEGIVKEHITPIVDTSSVRQSTTVTPLHSRWIGLAIVLLVLSQLVTVVGSNKEDSLQGGAV